LVNLNNDVLRTTSGNARSADHHEELGDFTITSRTIPISALAMGIGALCAFVALALVRLIGLFTNLFYFGRSTTWVPTAFSFPSPVL